MRVAIAGDVVVRDLADEAIILHCGTATYFGLDLVGARIWHLLEEHRSTEAIVPILLQEFDVEEQQLDRDLDALIAQLLAKQLLTAVDLV